MIYWDNDGRPSVDNDCMQPIYFAPISFQEHRMARVTVEDCLDNVDNRFELVLLAAKRARQLSTGGKDALVEVESDKATVLALREIAEGLITPDIMAREHELEAEEEFAASFETPVL